MIETQNKVRYGRLCPEFFFCLELSFERVLKMELQIMSLSAYIELRPVYYLE